MSAKPISTRLKQITGGIWFSLGAVFLLNEISQIYLLGSDGTYYTVFGFCVLGGYLVCCIVGGIRLLAGSGRWLISVLAALLAVYFMWIWGIAIWGMAEGAPEPFWLHLWCGLIVTFAIWSIVIARRRNPES